VTITGGDLELFERSLRHAVESASGDELDRALADLGWHDALADDPRTAVGRLFELQGRAGATSSALDVVLARALGLDPAIAVVLPPVGSVAPPGVGGEVEGLATAAIERARSVAVGTGSGVVVVPAASLRRTPVAGLDPELGLMRVRGQAAGGPVDGSRWSDAVRAGQLALAHELVGASRTMLQLARDHAVDRIQFDRPIAQLQAVRHRLAEAYVAIEGAHDAVEAAWEEGTPLAAATAKAIAGRGARVVAKHCQQVLAGIGFTLEHPFHRHLRRALVLDRLLGDAKRLTRTIGEELLGTREVPSMLAL
jgi:hypothetical protein